VLRIQIPAEKLVGKQSPNTVLIKAGMHRITAGKLLAGQPTRITNKSLTKLCLTLNCTPNDLLVFEEDPAQPLPPGHALKTLVRVADINLPEALRTLPPEKIEEIKNIIRQVNP